VGRFAISCKASDRKLIMGIAKDNTEQSNKRSGYHKCKPQTTRGELVLKSPPEKNVIYIGGPSPPNPPQVQNKRSVGN